MRPESSDPPATGTRALTWTLGTLQPGETRNVLIRARVKAGTPDNALVVNTAAASSPDLPGEARASAQLRVFTTTLLVDKAVTERTVDVGDVLHYTVTVGNPSAANLSSVTLTDTPAPGLQYLPGSARIENALTPDPAVTRSSETGGSTLTFDLGAMPAGTRRRVTYTLQVTPGAPPEPANTASAVAIAANSGTNGTLVRVSSNTSVATVTRAARLFGGRGEIIGRVYVDRSRSGQYLQNTDTPVAGARVLLAGGQEVLTDQNGRYHFADLTPGTYALRLDPASAPWDALPWPGDSGKPGSRTVDVWGLSNVDFPLQEHTGSVR